LNKLNTFTGYYSDLVAQAANSGYMYQTIHENQVNTVESIQSAREQIMGVSSDEELANMIRYQNAYNASSRYINVISQMLEHLVTSLGA
jgi:flagellar hook-associated protein 1 FlgK